MSLRFAGVAGHKLPLTQPYECFQTEFRSELGVLKVKLLHISAITG
jgi:hypothetical protein